MILCSDGDANLVIQNGEAQRVEARLVHRVDGQGNNLSGFEFASDHSKRFHTYRTVSQANVAALSWEQIGMDASSVATTKGEFVDQEIRASRRRTIAGESTYTAGDARTRSRWEANLARAQALTYVATVPSWRDATGALWRVNTAPFVEDEFAGIASRMAVTGLVFEDGPSGETTTITLLPPDAYASQAAVTELERRAQAAKDAKKGLGTVSLSPAERAELEHMELR